VLIDTAGSTNSASGHSVKNVSSEELQTSFCTFSIFDVMDCEHAEPLVLHILVLCLILYYLLLMFHEQPKIILS
jgi:hypothetical protein